jgi:hypothetical protein
VAEGNIYFEFEDFPPDAAWNEAKARTMEVEV